MHSDVKFARMCKNTVPTFRTSDTAMEEEQC